MEIIQIKKLFYTNGEILNGLLNKSNLKILFHRKQSGKFIENIISGLVNSGNHQLFWAPADKLANGVYFIRFKADQTLISQPVLLLK